MLADIYKDIISKENLRENLIKLKGELKEPMALNAFRYMLAGDYKDIISLLEVEDAKSRKNVAIILGLLQDDELVSVLWQGYKKESQMFVKASYLKAMGRLNFIEIIGEIEEEREKLTSKDYDETELKHIREILTELNKMLGTKFRSNHKFVGYNKLYDIVLTTTPVAIEELFKVLVESKCTGNIKKLKSGVLVENGKVDELKDIRIYNELLVVLNRMKALSGEPIEAARELAAGNLKEILLGAHKEQHSFRFRVELRGEKDKTKESTFVKKFAGELQRLCVGVLENSTSEYEIEIRLVKNKEEKYLAMLKVNTFKDERFAYRKNALPVSIHPVNAAITMKFLERYFKNDARVIDPLCGVGTLLIERKKAQDAATLYGVDKFGKAIDMARENTKLAGMTVNYINRDYFDFTHEHSFDEIITNMPGVSGKYVIEDIRKLYKAFFDKSCKILSKGGKIFVISNEKALIQSNVDSSKEYKLLEEYLLSKKDERYIFVIEKC